MNGFFVLGEPNNPWICMVTGHVDSDTFLRMLSDNGYTVQPRHKFTHEYWLNDDDGWRKCSSNHRGAQPVTVVRW